MCIVTFKATVVAPPSPPFIGLEVSIHLEADDMTFCFNALSFASGCAEHLIDWGDGTTETVSKASAVRHAYAAPGDYRIRLSDTCSTLHLCTVEDAPKVTGIICTAKRLVTLASGAIRACVNMTSADFRNSAVEVIARLAFLDCTGLSGELYFPNVNVLQYFSGQPPFSGCTGGITKLHFGKANEAAITMSDAYKADHTLGTGTAECVFDL